MKSALGMLLPFTSIPLSQIHALYIQSWCCLKAWSPSFPGMLNMMSSAQMPRRSILLYWLKAILLSVAGSLAMSIFHPLVAVGY